MNGKAGDPSASSFLLQPSSLSPRSSFILHPSSLDPPMLVIPPPASPRRTRRPPMRAPAALWLVTAAFDSMLIRLDLTFDRPVNIAAMDVTKLVVDDSDNGYRYHGSGTPTLVSPAHVRVTMTTLFIIAAPVTLVTAGTPTGIVADGA